MQPGSAPWLLAHELRLFWYHSMFTAQKGSGRRVRKRAIAIWILVWLAFHALAFALLRTKEFASGVVSPQLLVGATVAFAASFMLMLSSGLKASVEALFERADLDLLLSSPLPSRSISTVRLLGIIIGVASTYLFFLAPLADVGLLLGQFRWLAIYPVIFSAAAIAASLAMLGTLGLVRSLGARRTRVVAQIVGAIAGAFLFLLSQTSNWLPSAGKEALAQWLSRALVSNGPFGAGSMIWLPGKALLGTPAPVLWLLLSASAVLVLTIGFTHRFFVHGLQQVASSARVAKLPRAGLRFNFNRPLWELALLKEWRLIARDPHLISEVLLQLLYLIPMCLILFSKGSTFVPAMGVAMTMLCSSLASSLGWLAVLAEESPDLLLSAPANGRVIRFAKLSAAAMPPLAIVALPLLWLTVRNPVAGLITCFTVSGSVIGVSLVVQWSGKPAERSSFKTRMKGNGMLNWLGTASMFTWAGLSYFLLDAAGSRSPSSLQAVALAALLAIACIIPLVA
jgi:ABC-2 type transport system permease protein